MKEDILSKSYNELKQILADLKQPKYRADQIYYDLHNGKTLDEIEDGIKLGINLREKHREEAKLK